MVDEPVCERTLWPALREELQIMEGAREDNGAPRWVIFDPVRHRYFQLDKKNLAILQHWGLADASAICEKLHDLAVTSNDIDSLVRFLYANSLTVDPPDGDSTNYVRQAAAAKRSLLTSAIHNYLFIRIPLVRPHSFLKKTAGLTALFFTRSWWVFVGAVALAGLYLASRQWDYFVQTFLHFFNLKGLIFYAAALAFVKVAHELGHAYTATRYGCRVTTMGVAFLVMFPVLFTDTTDAWKLTSRRKRLNITAAGVITELTIAAFATLAWAFLPDGVWRSAAFFIATTAWIMSLSVNLNPLMRFDGYHFLSDAIGVHNLQARSFMLGRWALRECLFGLGEPAPETIPRTKRRGLIFFAWATWIYRFFLFLGIALLIHAIFFKVLGIVLFWIEIGWFILLPIFNELKEWARRRAAIIASDHTRGAAAVAATLIAIFVLPWGTTVRIPAVFEAEREEAVFAPQAAQLLEVHVANGDNVKAGDVLFRFASPQLEQKQAQAHRRIGLARAKLNRIAADNVDHDQTIVLRQELQRAYAELAALEKNAEQLVILAPFDGKVADLEQSLHDGRWINNSLALANIISTKGGRVRGYVSVEDVNRIDDVTIATFIPETPERKKVKTKIVRVETASAPTIPILALTSRYGGSITISSNKESVEPVNTWYGVTGEASVADPPQKIVRGQLQVQGKPESFSTKVWRQILKIGIRETSL